MSNPPLNPTGLQDLQIEPSSVPADLTSRDLVEIYALVSRVPRLLRKRVTLVKHSDDFHDEIDVYIPPLVVHLKNKPWRVTRIDGGPSP